MLAAHPAQAPRLAAGDRRRHPAAARFPRSLPVPLRALLADARPTRPPPELPRRLVGHAPAPVQRRARDLLRGDRPRDRVRPRTFSCPATVPPAAHGLGPRRCTGRRSRASTGWRCGVLDAVPIRHRAAPAAAAYAREAAVAEARAFLAERPYLSAERDPAHPHYPPALVSARRRRSAPRVAVVAEFYPSQRDPVLGVWAHRQALAARDAGAEVRVLVLHRLVPPRAALAGDRAAPRARSASARARAAQADTRRPASRLRPLRLPAAHALLRELGSVGGAAARRWRCAGCGARSRSI